MKKRNTTRTQLVASTLISSLIAAPLTALAALPATAAPEILTIADIQGTTDQTPYAGKTVTTRGVVTAVYAGGFNSYVIQTPHGTDTQGSQAIAIYEGKAPTVTLGDYVEVTGTAGEYNKLTQISSPTHTVLDEVVPAPQPLTISWPQTDEEREKYESMLFAPTGTYTVTNTYSTNQYGEVGLAFGNTPLVQPTDVGRPNSAEANDQATSNAQRSVILDDGTTTDFLRTKTHTPPYVSLTEPVRVGAHVEFSAPLIIDYRNNAWKLNPTTPTPAGSEIATFSNTRTSKPDTTKLAGSELKIASFNVLNYFTTTGEAWGTCTPYTDRESNGVTVRNCTTEGPRGAWNDTNLKRQQEKIVAAINATGADIVGLMEIENSVKLGETADEAVASLVSALNVHAGSSRWAYVPSSTDLPALEQQDVITNALIYNTTTVTPLGASRALGTQSGPEQPFNNAREPLGQAFTPQGGGEPLFTAVNHFKSKGSAGPLPGDSDAGDGQGSSNASRVAQAQALTQWVPNALKTIAAETGTTVKDVALLGDFNSYSQEDPMHVFYEAGYKNATTELNPGEHSYSFHGQSGSLDHILYNSTLSERTVGADIWDINAPESIALEYSRHNYHPTLFHAPNAYRSSDHDPVILGITREKNTTTTLNVLDINDFHGRIDSNTVKFAGTVEKSRQNAGDNKTLFVSAGDNIGASLFASALADDKPTLDVLNALELATSAVGNHEFDKGFADLNGRVNEQTNFNYLAANVYARGTTQPVLKTYDIFDVDGIKVGVIGAVTEETPTLVSPGGIADIEFGDPVAAVNRVAQQLSDGKTKNGEADVLIALYHEGAGAGTPDGTTLDKEIAAGGAFAQIVTKTAPQVDAIFTGHTHKQYAWLASNGTGAQRPVIQTGSYGEYIGQALLTIDRSTKTVTNAEANNLARLKDDDATLVQTYPRVAQVKNIVDAARAEADRVGAQQVGTVTADITTAFSGGAYVNGVYTGGKRDDRSEASTLGNLVADALHETLAEPQRGGADIGVVNPGGLRAELLHAPDGAVTYAEANAVLPFVNNLWTTTLTGTQVKTLLEQQWQTNADGTIPSRPYLQLGLSKNVTYTYDETRAHGDRITSITVNNQPIDPAAQYVIGTFSFLAQGGDNFRVFNDGTNTKDSGLIDRDAWISYLQQHPNLTPNYARSGTAISAVPTTVKVGDTIDFTANRMDVRSLGAPHNTEIKAHFTGPQLSTPVSVGTFPITDGIANISITVPAAAQGATTLQLVATESHTTITVPLTVTSDGTTDPEGAATTTNLNVGASHAGKKTSLTATVKTQDKATRVAGTVTFYNHEQELKTVTVRGGKAKAKIFLPAGEHSLKAVFTPKDPKMLQPSTSAAVQITTEKAASRITATLGSHTITYLRTTTVYIKVKSRTIKPTGTVDVLDGTTKIGTAQLIVTGKNRAVAAVKLPKLKPGRYTFNVAYSGNDQLAAITGKTGRLTVKTDHDD
ncbi:ExeM/NucH family extracellular endonuclease [Timonella sp. A28]|uniref:ExeM/NucH family extracellular endonuclease n=1 Tax=Timonella sp. A28 TaxID=3442640 RepID=UPI003EBE29DE